MTHSSPIPNISLFGIFIFFPLSAWLGMSIYINIFTLKWRIWQFREPLEYYILLMMGAKLLYEAAYPSTASRKTEKCSGSIVNQMRQKPFSKVSGGNNKEETCPSLGHISMGRGATHPGPRSPGVFGQIPAASSRTSCFLLTYNDMGTIWAT